MHLEALTSIKEQDLRVICTNVTTVTCSPYTILGLQACKTDNYMIILRGSVALATVESCGREEQNQTRFGNRIFRKSMVGNLVKELGSVIDNLTEGAGDVGGGGNYVVILHADLR